MFGLDKLGDLSNLMKGAQEMQKKMTEMQEKLADVTAVGESGGGLVRVTSNGRQEILEVAIDDAVANGGDREMLQDLVASATNQALAKAREIAQDRMQDVLGGLPPGLGNLANMTNPGA